jgi:hypothetical protein
MIDINLPKPRTIEMETTPEFNALIKEVRDVLSGHLDGAPL